MKSKTGLNLANAERIAKLLDNQFKIGPFRFGIDPLIGLIPGAGDIISLVFSSYLISVAYQEKISSQSVQKMVANLLIDLVISTVPLVGDLGDFYFKASARNMKILKTELEKKDYLSSKEI